MWKPKFKSATDPLHFYIAGGVVVLGTILVFLGLYFGMPLPEAASEQAGIIDTLIRWHLVVIAFLFSLVIGFMIYAIVAFRKREDDDSEGAHFEGNTTLEIAWTVLPLILVVIFAFYGIRSLNNVTSEKPNEIAIEAEGLQWAWNFTYDNGVKSVDLVLPLNRPVVMNMHSKDVMHGFWVPQFRVKQDLVPGQETHLRFTPTEVGEWDLVCTNLCGLNHYAMKAKVKVVPEAEFTVWLNEALVDVNPALASK